MELILATSLTGYRDLVRELDGDADRLLAEAGIPPEDAGRPETFIPLRSAVRAVEQAAIQTGTADFGRRLAARQTMDILGPVGVAARTAATVAEVFLIFDRFVAAYSPGIAVSIRDTDDPGHAFVEWQLRLDPLPAHPQTIELSLGIMLGVLRRFLGPDYAPSQIHIPHRRLSTEADYRRYYGCALHDESSAAGFRVEAADLAQTLDQDLVAHQSLVGYLDHSVTELSASASRSVAETVRPMLPSGAVAMDLIAHQFGLHPKALQRRLAAEGVTFAGIVDRVRRETAERYLRDTEMSLLHLSRQLGYAEQSILTRACQRWFGQSPLAYRQLLRSGPTAEEKSVTFDGPT